MTLKKNQTFQHGLFFYQPLNACDINVCQNLGSYCDEFEFETMVHNSNGHGVKNRVRSNDGVVHKYDLC